MKWAEPDPLLRRLQVGALLWCAGCTALAVMLAGPGMAVAVLGGGGLAAVSLLAIRASVDALVSLSTGSAAARPARGDEAHDEASGEASAKNPSKYAVFTVLKLTARYALLGLMAYAMIARLRLHPVGLLIGASSMVASASLEAARMLTRPRIS